MTDIVAVAAIAAFSGFSTAWLHWQINKNACGGAKCVKTMTDALHVHREKYNFPGGYDATDP